MIEANEQEYLQKAHHFTAGMLSETIPREGSAEYA